MCPNLALKLIDVAEDGVQVLLTEPVRAGELLEVALWPAGGAVSARGPGVVCWCLPTPAGEFRAGMQLRRRLDPGDVTLLGE
jgi:hypothetical protein